MVDIEIVKQVYEHAANELQDREDRRRAFMKQQKNSGNSDEQAIIVYNRVLLRSENELRSFVQDLDVRIQEFESIRKQLENDDG